MKKVVADASQEDAKKKRADLAKEGFEKALANMRELAEITTQSRERGLRRGSQEDRRERGRYPKFWKKSWQMNSMLWLPPLTPSRGRAHRSYWSSSCQPSSSLGRA